jgi:RNA polymerase sigma factor (sigma-70 family)
MTPSTTPSDSLDIDELYRRCGPMVLRRAQSILGNPADARDVLQEVFMRLVEKPQQFEHRAAITTYLYAASTHACLNRMRNRKRRSVLIDLFVKPAVVEGKDGPADAWIQFRQLLTRMPQDLAEVLVYSHVDELTQDEIAAIVGCARRTVSDRLTKANALARQLQGGQP